jgi:hypothetical protein
VTPCERPGATPLLGSSGRIRTCNAPVNRSRGADHTGSYRLVQAVLALPDVTEATHIARDAGEFTHYRRNANHSINRAANRAREQIEKDEWAASIWREQLKLREAGFHKAFYRSGDARSRSPLDEFPGEQPNETHPEEADANPASTPTTSTSAASPARAIVEGDLHAAQQIADYMNDEGIPGSERAAVMVAAARRRSSA